MEDGMMVVKRGWSKGSVLSLVVMASPLVVACASEPAPVEDAVEVDLDGVEAQDYGTAWNGWSMFANGIYAGGVTSLGQLNYFLYKNSGSEPSRGGGACWVLQKTGSSCSNDAAGDAACTSGAVAQFGAGAYGYCWNNVCYDRPGTQSFCTLGPARTPGQYVMTGPGAVTVPPGYNFAPFVLGCMTKTQGPNPACGGTNQSLYMRTVVAGSRLPY
jgi:hypothetical protein